MPRPPLPIGTWGQIRTRVVKTDAKGKAVRHQSRAKFRDFDGKTRKVSAEGKTATAAENNLRKKLQERAKTSRSGELTAMHRVRQAYELWEKKFAEKVTAGRRSPGSLQAYRSVAAKHVLPRIGELRLGEANTPRIDDVISEITTTVGAPTAKTCRSVISGLMGLAVRYGAISANPVRDVESIENNAKKSPRALTGEEVQLLRKQLASDERAGQADLPDLVTFCSAPAYGSARRWLSCGQVNFETGEVEITDTIVRIKGEGLIRKITKSDAGQRVLPLPQWTLAMLRARFAAGIRLDEAVFADMLGGFRDPANVRRSLRQALSPVGSAARRDLGLTLRCVRRQAELSRKDVVQKLNWPQNKLALIETGRVKLDRDLATDLLRLYCLPPEATEALLTKVDEASRPVPADTLAWIRSHAFRKTTATALDGQGQTARQIADHLGHSRVSMTQDNYLGRKSTNPTAAEALQRAFEDPDLDLS